MNKAKKNIGGGLIDGTGIMDSQVKSHIEGNVSTVDAHAGLDQAMSPVQTHGPSKSVNSIGKMSGGGKAAGVGFPAARAVKPIDNVSKIGHQRAKK